MESRNLYHIYLIFVLTSSISIDGKEESQLDETITVY